MKIYGKLGTQPAFFYFHYKTQFIDRNGNMKEQYLNRKVKFALQEGKYAPKYEGMVDNISPLRISYL